MNASSEEIEIEIPEAVHFLITESARYKVLWGGRGGSKTESVAICLIALSLNKTLRIACFREFQKSIKESVHSTIKSIIIERHLEHLFDISDTSIVCKLTGSEFIFSGLRYNIDSIKSMARIDIAWVEEARNVSRTSWTKLGPTIRGRHESDPNGMGGPFGDGPEIWVTFNPELKDDDTYKRFVLKPPSEFNNNVTKDDIAWFKSKNENNLDASEVDRYKFVRKNRYSIIKKINYYDNKFFPSGLRAEMEEDKAVSDDKYLEVWEGHVKQVLEGAVYAKELKKVLLDGRRGKVPYDPNRPVLTSWDLGHADKTAIWFIQRVNMEYNLIHYYENRLEKLPHYLKYMQDLGYVYGTCYQPHDAENETLAARSIAKQTRDAGYTVITVDRPAKKVLGINAARSIFDLCNFDEENTSDGWDCLANYAYKVNEDNGNFSREPDHDTPWSHGADAWQTFALSIKTETAAKKKLPVGVDRPPIITGAVGWMQ